MSFQTNTTSAYGQAMAENIAAAEARNTAIRTVSPDGMTAMERAMAKIERSGRIAARNHAMSFARRFLLTPALLNAISWNLSHAEPEAGIREVRRIARQDGDTIQLCGALIAFRWARRHERAQAETFLIAAE